MFPRCQLPEFPNFTATDPTKNATDRTASMGSDQRMLWIQRFSLLPSSSCPKGRRMARRSFRSQRPSPTPPWTQRIWPPTTQAKGNLKKGIALWKWQRIDTSMILDDSGWFWMILALETRSVIIVCWNPSFTFIYTTKESVVFAKWFSKELAIIDWILWSRLCRMDRKVWYVWLKVLQNESLIKRILQKVVGLWTKGVS